MCSTTGSRTEQLSTTKKTVRDFPYRLFLCKRACKPGSVLEDSHLSRPAVADRLKPPPRDGRAGLCVPPRCCSGIEFTATDCSQPSGELLPRLSTLTGRRGVRRYISVALVLRSPPAGVTRYPCPAEPGLSSWVAFRRSHAAVQPACRGYCSRFRTDCQIRRGNSRPLD